MLVAKRSRTGVELRESLLLIYLYGYFFWNGCDKWDVSPKLEFQIFRFTRPSPLAVSFPALVPYLDFQKAGCPVRRTREFSEI